MTITLRIVLIVASILTCTWIIQRIRKAQIKIEDSVFWILFSGVLILMSIFPRLVEWGTKLTGVQSPVNFVFLSILFILIIKLFRMTIKISQIENKFQSFVQAYALNEYEQQEAKDEDDASMFT